MIVRLCQLLTESNTHAAVAQRIGASLFFTKRAAVDPRSASAAGDLRCGRPSHVSSGSVAWTCCSWATRRASSTVRRPTSRPSEVVMGDDVRSWWIM